jgi:hypothetical protein
MVPVDVLRELSRGSFEHLSFRLDDTIAENRHMFVGKREVDVARLATFQSHVLVGTEDGQYFKAKYEDVNGRIKMGLPERLDVPVVESSNAGDYIREYALGAVDAILAGNKTESRERLLALVKLEEAVETGEESLTDIIRNHLNQTSRQWRSIYSEQKEAISAEIKDLAEAFVARKVDAKYVPLYDGTIPEEKFESYRDAVGMDLGVIADRLDKVQTGAETAFLPFAESIANVTRTAEDDQVLQQFESFANDYFEDLQEAREHLAFALKNEQCVMCLGQIHDALAEALTDYEIAGTFVEHMSKRFTEAK